MCIETFSPQIFPLLFRAHPFLERVRLNCFNHFHSEFVSATDFDFTVYGRETFDWCLLQRIKVLSLHPRIISDLDIIEHVHPTLDKFLTVFSSLDEVEICPNFGEWPMYLILTGKSWIFFY